MRAFVVAAVVAICAPAFADVVSDREARGEALAKQAQWSAAIEEFKAADQLRPLAKHACLIGLAYTRRELWPEAELFFSLCHARASATDPLPEWIDEAERQLAEKLAASSASEVAIEVTPPAANATLSLSSFAPGETFTPRTLHLAPGSHVITVTAPGYEPVKRDITVESGKPQRVAIALALVHPPPSRVPLYFYAAGGALALVGIAYDELVLQPLRTQVTTKYYYQYDVAPISRLHTSEQITVGLFAGAAVAAAAGVILHYTVFRHHESLRPSVAVGPSAAMIGVEWTP